jgi:glycosyltransferase involved in cell wall biosynthesis
MKTKWPRISIVTPSLNQGGFIEAAIQSILSQKYPNLEYLIIDGGSTDNTLSILKKYNDQVKWISEEDNGQTDAINKGLGLVSGELLAYLNADDILLPGSLFGVANVFRKHPDVQWLTGRCKIIDDKGKAVREFISLYKNVLLFSSSFHLLLVTNYISQPATFWRKELIDICGFFDANLSYVMDYEYWLRIWKVATPHIYHQKIAGFRIQPNSKTTSGGHLQDYIDEENLVVARHSPSKVWCYLHDLHRVIMTNTYRFINR